MSCVLRHFNAEMFHVLASRFLLVWAEFALLLYIDTLHQCVCVATVCKFTWYIEKKRNCQIAGIHLQCCVTMISSELAQTVMLPAWQWGVIRSVTAPNRQVKSCPSSVPHGALLQENWNCSQWWDNFCSHYHWCSLSTLRSLIFKGV